MSAKLMENNYGNFTRVRTSRVRLSFPHLFEKDSMTGKYGCDLLIPKDDKELLKIISTAIKNAKEDGKERVWGGKLPAKLREPISDGDEEDKEGYENCYVLKPKTTRRIEVFDMGPKATCGTIDDAEDLYPGCYVQAIIEFAPYDNQGKGVTSILLGLKKVADGEHLGGTSYQATADDFDDGEDGGGDDLGGDEDDLGLPF